MAGKPRRTIGVVGAGIVGACTALLLQRNGWDVILLDRDEPGAACSFGNAALILPSLTPFASLGTLKRLPGLLLRRDAPVRIGWRFVFRHMGWGLRFLLASRKSRYLSGIAKLHALGAEAVDAYRRLLGDDFATHVRGSGYLVVFEDEAQFRDAAAGAALRRQFGADIDVIDLAAARKIEPRIGASVCGALHIKGTHWVRDPQALTTAIAAKFLAAGGRIEQSEVLSVAPPGGTGKATIVRREGRLEVDAAVIAAGIATPRLAATSGGRVHIAPERGYHAMLPMMDPPLNCPIMSGDGYFVLTPLDGGTRLAGLADFRGNDAPDFTMLTPALATAHRILPDLDIKPASQWTGVRPSAPDSLPIIKSIDAGGHIFVASGHGHAGLTLGAVTAEIIVGQLDQVLRQPAA